ncbi:MAG TPA: hypothetical protein ENI76_00200 [Ignavibacteria bacterium]|nr:hypothetical protein [Ignavibacteria bacterium]
MFFQKSIELRDKIYFSVCDNGVATHLEYIYSKMLILIVAALMIVYKKKELPVIENGNIIEMIQIKDFLHNYPPEFSSKVPAENY